jgi:hypothetical protein
MTAATLIHTGTTFEELLSRESNGISVSLLWNREDDTLTVCVFDASTDTSFEFEVGAASPLDVFHHPFAYAAHRGLLPEPEAHEVEDAEPSLSAA